MSYIEICVLLTGGLEVSFSIEEFKDFSWPLSDIPVLFKADLIFEDFSRKPSKFKYFSSLCEPWLGN